MKQHVIIPHKGIMDIQLGMSKLEIDSVFDKKSVDKFSDEEILSDKQVRNRFLFLTCLSRV